MAWAIIMKAIAGSIDAAAKERAGQQQQRIANFNADQMEHDALVVEAATKDALRTHRNNLQRLIGAQRAATEGVRVDTGSAALLNEEAAAEGARDEIAIAFAGEYTAARFRNEAEVEKFKGREAKLRGTLGAASANLGAGSDIAGSQGG